ncbi:hypothetical protein H0H92_007398, partial [Tricholoma furcatifolium]
KSKDDLFEELWALRVEVVVLKQKIDFERAMRTACEAHCTMIQAELGETLTRLQNTRQKKTRGSTKIKAWFVTHPELKEAFEKEEVERLEKERIEAEKEMQKVALANARTTRIARDSVLKTFLLPISTLKKKEDLEVLVTALELSTKGTVQELTQRLKGHLTEHPELANNPRFAGLFAANCRQKDNTASGGPSVSAGGHPTSQLTVKCMQRGVVVGSSSVTAMSHAQPGMSTTTSSSFHPGYLVAPTFTAGSPYSPQDLYEHSSLFQISR